MDDAYFTLIANHEYELYNYKICNNFIQITQVVESLLVKYKLKVDICIHYSITATQ